MEKAQKEKRRFRRSREYGPRKIKIAFRDPAGKAETCQAKLWDFSEGGLGMDSPKEFQPGQVVDIEADLYGPAYSVALKAKARVAYCRRVDVKHYRVGVAFLETAYRRIDASRAGA